jgi:hypothetical protein
VIEQTYFIAEPDGGPIKIGRSKTLKIRKKCLQSGNWRKLLLIATSDEAEKALHTRFKKYRIYREWFAPAPEILYFIKNETDLTVDFTKYYANIYAIPDGGLNSKDKRKDKQMATKTKTRWYRKDVLRVGEWVRTNHKNIVEKWTQVQAAKKASSELNLKVTPKQIVGIARDLGLELPSRKSLAIPQVRGTEKNLRNEIQSLKNEIQRLKNDLVVQVLDDVQLVNKSDGPLLNSTEKKNGKRFEVRFGDEQPVIINLVKNLIVQTAIHMHSLHPDTFEATVLKMYENENQKPRFGKYDVALSLGTPEPIPGTDLYVKTNLNENASFKFCSKMATAFNHPPGYVQIELIKD